MFFVLSKLLAFGIKPISWLFILLIGSLLGRRVKFRRRCGWLAFWVLLLFSNKGLFNLAAHLWELPPQKVQVPYDAGILLGGFSNQNGYPQDGRYHFGPGANRFTQTLELYEKGKIKQIIITSGSANVTGKKISEATEAMRFLQTMHLPKEAIVIETRSRNTHENAEFTAQLVKNHLHETRCLLITSAWHMRRAKACFAKVGFPLDYYCTDYLQERYTPWMIIQFQPDVLGKWEALIKEWVGMLAYWAAGYI
jgi:uncharacterized SAM-binding protein YcdF (DUF218 family)